MTHLALMLLSLHGLIPSPPPHPATRFYSHAGPAITLAPGLKELGIGTGLTFASPFLVSGATAALLGGAAIAAVALQPIDQGLYDEIHKLTHLTAKQPGIFGYTVYLGEGYVDLGIVWLFSFGGPKARRTSVEGTEALLAVAVISTVAKRFFRVPRPDKTTNYKKFFQKFSLNDSTNDAFPSGHSMSAFATAAVISNEYPQAAPFAYAAATLVGFSVIEKGWHWPSDVVMGAALGYVIGRGAVLANEKLNIGIGPAQEGLGLSANGRF